MNRAQRILHYVAGCTKPASLAEITAAVAVGEARPVDDPARFNVTVAAQLSQLVGDKKLARHGMLRAFTYTSTPLTLVDLRKVDRAGAPRVRSQSKKRARKPAQPPIANRKAAKPSAAQQPTARTHAQRLALANLGPPAKRKPGERETVEEFLARGGRIQKLAHGESSQPAYVDVRAVDQRAMRARLLKALDTEPANTSDDKAVAA